MFSLRARRGAFLSSLLLLSVWLLLSGAGYSTAAPASQSPAPTTTPPSRPMLLTDPVPDPGQAGVLWFAPTGHTLRGRFLDYWHEHGGLPQFGYPITEEFTEPIGTDGAPIMVQYFERARFEHHPEHAGTPHEVLLGALGRDFHPQDPPASPLPSPDVFPPIRVYFNETGHNLGGVFLRYWNEHGGLAVHGYPISEEFEEKSPINGKTYRVQYFERSRLELHPENAGSPYEVLLGQLGTQLSRKNGYPYGWYPLYGHAGDFSWVAGEAVPPRKCAQPVCRCDFKGDTELQPVGAGWRPALDDGQVAFYKPVVLFGRPAREDEPKTQCPFPGYMVNRVQPIPAT